MIEILGLPGLPEVRAGDSLAALALTALHAARIELRPGDVLVFTSKIVSKAEGRVIELETVTPSPFAMTWASQFGKDPRHVEVVLGETQRIVRMDHGVLVAETRHGFVCANAGVDASNAAATGQLLLLPLDPDGSARRLRETLREMTGQAPAVIITDTFGRPWRTGQTNIAIGAAGILPLQRYAGSYDPNGYAIRATSIAVIDELAGAAELVMGKLDRVPLALIRGYDYPQVPPGEPDEGASVLVRQATVDLFR